jgi:hypothetical protein
VVDKAAGSIAMSGNHVRRLLAEAARARQHPAPGT